MYKRILFLFSFIIASTTLAQQETALFGYNQDLMVVQSQRVASIIKNQKIKKFAFYGVTGALLVGVFSLKLMKHFNDADVNAQITMDASAQKLMGWKIKTCLHDKFIQGEIGFDTYQNYVKDLEVTTQGMGWGQWLWNGTKWIAGEATIRGSSSYIIGLYGGYTARSLPTASLGLYIQNHTHFQDILKELEDDADLLPLEEDYEERFYKSEIFEEKLKIMIPSIAGIIAYMIYVKEQVAKESAIEAVRMEYIIEHLKKSLNTFCVETEQLLQQYKKNKDTQEAMILAVNIPSKLGQLRENIYSDIKSFERYEDLAFE